MSFFSVTAHFCEESSDHLLSTGKVYTYRDKLKPLGEVDGCLGHRNLKGRIRKQV
jgi:hypothetical protein